MKLAHQAIHAQAQLLHLLYVFKIISVLGTQLLAQYAQQVTDVWIKVNHPSYVLWEVLLQENFHAPPWLLCRILTLTLRPPPHVQQVITTTMNRSMVELSAERVLLVFIAIHSHKHQSHVYLVNTRQLMSLRLTLLIHCLKVPRHVRLVWLVNSVP